MDKHLHMCVCVCVQNGQLTYQAMIRHKDPRMCAVAAVGLFHMGLFSIMGYEFPDLLGEDKSW